MNDDIGKFIKEQRSKKKISQEKLSELLFVDRTLISKWENGKLTTSIKEIIKMAKIFEVSVEEFLSGELYNSNNKEEINNNFSNYLIEQDNKLHKFKKIIYKLSVISILFLLLFLIYYFKQTFNKTRVYRVTGISENYELNSGILLITRGKSYLKIGNFSDNITSIKIFYKINDEELTIHEGNPNDVTIDNTKYNSSINLNNFDSIKDNVYMYIYDKEGKYEIMHLEFDEDFANNVLIYNDMDKYIIDNYENDVEIPENIKNDFECTKEFCRKKIDDIEINYDYVGSVIYFSKADAIANYIINKKYYSYSKNNIKFTVLDNKFECVNIDYNEAKKIYDYYYKLIEKYI